MADVAFLERLALTSPHDLVAQTPAADGQTLGSLYDQCRAAGLTAQPAESDVHRLHALFDVAWRHGLASFVCDYLADVCSDPLTSADPVRAYLLDGRCVGDWTRKALQRLRSGVRQVLAGGLDAPGVDEQLHAEALRAAGLLAIVRALGRQPDSDDDGDAASEVARLKQTLQVCELLRRYDLVPARPCGQHSSEQAWRSRANKRRDGAAPAQLLIADLVHRLRDVAHVDASYPPQSLKGAVELFLAGSPTPAAFAAKLAFLQYSLLDLGVPSVCDALRDGLGLPAEAVEQTRAGFLLDDAACGKDSGSALQQASRILPGIAGADLPLSFVTALADRGALATALVVQQARQQPGTTTGDSMQALQDAEALLHISMQFGLVHEAFCQIRQHVASVDLEDRPNHARRLLHTLAELAEAAGSWVAILKLPFSGAEQAQLAAWLRDPHHASAARNLPLMLLQRGRLAEALAAAATLNLEGDEELRWMLTTATQLLPAAQQLLRVHDASAGPGGMLGLSQPLQGGDRGTWVLPPGKQPPAGHLLPLHVRPAGEQRAPLLTGSLHPDNAAFAAKGGETQRVDGSAIMRASPDAAGSGSALPWPQHVASQQAGAIDGTEQVAATASDPFGGVPQIHPVPQRRVKRARLGSVR